MSRINNEFRVSGRMGGPLEKNFNPNNGNPIGRVNVAVDASYTNRETGEIVERVTWLDLTFYTAKHIERLEQFGGKGREIHVMGHINKDVWDSKTRKNDDGSPMKDSRLSLIVTSLLLGREPRTENDNAPSDAAAAPDDLPDA